MCFWAQLSEGCYLLRSNLTGVDAATLWKRYIQLTEAEWAFRISKDELEIRPIWHHKEERVKRISWSASSRMPCGRRWLVGWRSRIG